MPDPRRHITAFRKNLRLRAKPSRAHRGCSVAPRCPFAIDIYRVSTMVENR
nr:hypothetical protein [Mesorhizobium sp.]